MAHGTRNDASYYYSVGLSGWVVGPDSFSPACRWYLYSEVILLCEVR